MKTEELGIIKDINVGMRDTNSTICWFQVQILNGSSLQIISLEQMKKMIEEAQVFRLQDLNGKACVVKTEGNYITFSSIVK